MDGLTPDQVRRRRGRQASARFAEPAQPGLPARSAAPSKGAISLGQAADLVAQLLTAHGTAHTVSARAFGGDDDTAAARFARLACADSVQASAAETARLRAAGASPRDLVLALLIPAARHLAQCWQSDRCRYEDLVVGTLHLQELLHELSAEPLQAIVCERRALVLSAPAERSMLGLFLVTEFYRCASSELFRHAGWEVWQAPPNGHRGLLRLLQEQWFDAIEVAAVSRERLPSLAADLALWRAASRNPRIKLLVAGPAVESLAEPATVLGAGVVVAEPGELPWSSGARRLRGAPTQRGLAR